MKTNDTQPSHQPARPAAPVVPIVKPQSKFPVTVGYTRFRRSPDTAADVLTKALEPEAESGDKPPVPPEAAQVKKAVPSPAEVVTGDGSNSRAPVSAVSGKSKKPGDPSAGATRTAARAVTAKGGEAAAPLSDSERADLRKCEKIITGAWTSLTDANHALLVIRAKKLYREEFKTFEAYCQKRWALARSTAYQRIEFAATHQALSAMADISAPVNERQVRALAGLSPEDKQRVWREANQPGVKGAPTSRDVKQARIKLGLKAPAKGKAEAEDADAAPGTLATSEARFDTKGSWQKFRDLLDQEFENWPADSCSIFIKNLRAAVGELEAIASRSPKTPPGAAKTEKQTETTPKKS